MFNPIWKALSNDEQEHIKKFALQAFINEKDKTLLPKVTEALVQIASNVFNIAPSDQNTSVWPDIITCAISYASADSSQVESFRLESGLRLIEGIFGYIYESLSNTNNSQEIVHLISKVGAYLYAKDLAIATKAVKTVSEMTFYANKKELKAFKDFILQIMTVTLTCLNSGKENELKICCKAIIEMSSNNSSSLFKQHFADLFILMGKISEKKNFDDDNLRELGFEVIVNLVEMKPKFLSSDVEKLKTFIEALYKYALGMEAEITTDWSTPTQDSYFDEEFIYEKEVSTAISFLERLID